MNILRMIWWLSLVLLVAASALAQQKETFQIVGVVRDAAAHPAARVLVRVQSKASGLIEEQKTDSAGAFSFSSLQPGSYVVSAFDGERRSGETSVAGVSGATERLELRIALTSAPAASTSPSQNKIAADMEFTDVPSFTVAAVTDWTAAGGHGSDVNLRASESLTRDTLRMNSAVSNPGASSKDITATERGLREAVMKSPRDRNANEQLGRFYLSLERYHDAIEPLDLAYQADPDNAKSEYALAVALARGGDRHKAREHVLHLLAKGDKPEWHRLAGEVDEKLGDPLSAVRSYEKAVKGDPSEENYFAWGTELLEHRAIWQAKDVLEAAVAAHPNSTRLLTALGAALFGGALYDEAAQRLCAASDLSPQDVQPYLFLGQVEIASPNPLPCIESRLARFQNQQPGNAMANYYYAMTYWKQHGKSTDTDTLDRVTGLLKKAIEDDPKGSSAYLQLGVIEASRSDFARAAEWYHKAIEADPQSTDAYYRLGVAYDRLGEKEKAAEQFKLHDRLKREQAAAVEQQRREVKQFLVLVGSDGPEPSGKK